MLKKKKLQEKLLQSTENKLMKIEQLLQDIKGAQLSNEDRGRGKVDGGDPRGHGLPKRGRRAPFGAVGQRCDRRGGSRARRDGRTGGRRTQRPTPRSARQE